MSNSFGFLIYWISRINLVTYTNSDFARFLLPNNYALYGHTASDFYRAQHIRHPPKRFLRYVGTRVFSKPITKTAAFNQIQPI